MFIQTVEKIERDLKDNGKEMNKLRISSIQDRHFCEFGIEVRNVRGIKCHELGLINSNKECQSYNQVMSAHPAETSLDSFELLQQRKKSRLLQRKREV